MRYLSTATDSGVIFFLIIIIFKTPISCQILEYQLVFIPYSFPRAL